MEESVEGYRGSALQLLRKFNAKPGQIVEVMTSDGLQTRGLIIPRYLHADDSHLVLKLKSGYNVGLKVETIQSLKPVAGAQESIADENPTAPQTPYGGGKKKLLLVSTGGTIASRVDYRTGAVFPALSASDLYAAVPELNKLATIEPEVVFSITSENMTPGDWTILSSKIIELTKLKNPDGVVVMMGTDTLGYAAAALSFSLIGFEKPVVIVGAQRSSDRPSSDAALNLRSASLFAVESKVSGVYVAMHRNENDTDVAIHAGTRVRKNHTSRRDAFQSIDSPLVAVVRNASEIILNREPKEFRSPPEYLLKTSFESKVALVKFHPGFDPNVLEFLVKNRSLKGMIIEGTGLGHVSDPTVAMISKLVAGGTFVGITSQCIWGHVDLNVYGPGRDLIASGATPLENMFAETAFSKLSWVMGNFLSGTREIMLTNLLGEFDPRIPLTENTGPSDK